MNNIEAQKRDGTSSSAGSLASKILMTIIIVLLLVILILGSVTLYNNNIVKSTIKNIFENTKQNSYKPILQQLKSKCGRSASIKHSSKFSNSRIKRVINGTEAIPHNWPWVVGFFDSNNEHYCGGALVHPYYVLTAAHCVDDKVSSTIFVKAGIHKTGEGDLLKVRKVFIHEDYDNGTLMNDIALVRLVYPVNITKQVSPICLPDYELYDSHVIGKSGIVAGWGSLGYLDDEKEYVFPKNLQETKVVIRDDERCDNAQFNIDVEYCVFGLDSKAHSNICDGDSGGPLFMQINGLWTIIGIVSSSTQKDADGTSVCDASSASYFAKVNIYLDWMLPKIVKL